MCSVAFLPFYPFLERRSQIPALVLVLSVQYIISLDPFCSSYVINISKTSVVSRRNCMGLPARSTHAKTGKEFLRFNAFWRRIYACRGFGFFQKHSLHILVSSLTFNDHNVTWGNLSLNCFLAASPSDRYNTLTTFLLAGSSSKSPISARTLGFCWDASLVNSVREIEYFAINATWNKSTHLSHSIVGLELASYHKTGSPTRWDNEDD